MKKLTQFIKNNDTTLAIVFAVLSILFVVCAFTVPSFFEWVFARHENILSWYIRPLFLIPFCIFAFRRSLAGISLTVFLLLTSMFWFPQPTTTPDMVKEFLAIEKDYLLNNWDVAKVGMTLLVPATLSLLAYAFWRRNLYLGLAVMALIAVMKSGWSLLFGGESGAAVIAPAMVGLLACCAFIYIAVKKSKKQRGVNK